MRRFVRLSLTGIASVLASVAIAAPSSASASSNPAMHAMGTLKTAQAQRPHGGGSNNLGYRGGSVDTGPTKVYLILWGSQWNGGDPSGEPSILQSFLGKVGGSGWNNTVSQYCQGVTSGSTTTPCTGTGSVANAAGMFGGSYPDTASPAPSSPTQSQLAAEAAKAVNSGWFPYSASAQYVVLTASGDSQNGFATQWCAYHSSTSSNSGSIAWTYLPYITDAGASCGANFNGLGPKAGITIVEGHEMAESETDPFPSSGWLDGRGSEIGDKCAWISSGQGASASVNLNGTSFPVQSLWSNAFNSSTGGCVLSY